jgi:NTP pyrophosphatase (non-canonical NTP hydrolase)
MNSEEYIENALKTESTIFKEIIERFSDEKVIRGIHAAIGMVTESAELIDVFKKFLFYGKPVDWINIEEEIGDQFWYIAIMANVLGHDNFNRIMQKNINKLKARYGERFSENDALYRDLAKERGILEEI